MSVKATGHSSRRRRKTFTVVWIAALALLTMSLIYWEQVALLYIFATLGVTALLVVVGLANLGGAEPDAGDIGQATNAVSAGGINSSYQPNQTSSWTSRKKS